MSDKKLEVIPEIKFNAGGDLTPADKERVLAIVFNNACKLYNASIENSKDTKSYTPDKQILAASKVIVSAVQAMKNIRQF